MSFVSKACYLLLTSKSQTLARLTCVTGQSPERRTNPGKIGDQIHHQQRLNYRYSVQHLRYPGSSSAQKSPEIPGRIVHNLFRRVFWLRIVSYRTVETPLEENPISRQHNSLRLLVPVCLTSPSSLRSVQDLGIYLH